jgi:hypothetical protein
MPKGMMHCVLYSIMPAFRGFPLSFLVHTSLAGGRWPRLLHDGKRGLVRSLPGTSTEYSEYKVCIMAFSSICFMDVRTFLF